MLCIQCLSNRSTWYWKESSVFIFWWQTTLGILGTTNLGCEIHLVRSGSHSLSVYERSADPKVREEFLNSLHKLLKSRWSNSSFCNFCQLIHPHTTNQRFHNKLKSSVSDSDGMISPIWPHCGGFSLAGWYFPLYEEWHLPGVGMDGEGHTCPAAPAVSPRPGAEGASQACRDWKPRTHAFPCQSLSRAPCTYRTGPRIQQDSRGLPQSALVCLSAFPGISLPQTKWDYSSSPTNVTSIYFFNF